MNRHRKIRILKRVPTPRDHRASRASTAASVAARSTGIPLNTMRVVVLLAIGLFSVAAAGSVDHDYDHHDFKCHGKPDGPYALGHCRHSFAQCSGGVTSYQKCPSELVYGHHGSCVHKQRCDSHHHHPDEHYHKHHDYPAHHVRHPDKHYRHPEKQYDHRPEHRYDHRHYRHPDQHYEHDEGHHQYRHPEKHHFHHPEHHSEHSYDRQHYHHPGHHYEHHYKPHHEHYDHGFCASKPDGVYAAGCDHHYFACSAHNTYKQHCPPSLYYSKSLKQCETREKVPECKL